MKKRVKCEVVDRRQSKFLFFPRRYTLVVRILDPIKTGPETFEIEVTQDEYYKAYGHAKLDVYFWNVRGSTTHWTPYLRHAENPDE